MTIEKAIQALMDGEPIVVAGQTFDAIHIESIRLETGEMFYLAQNEDDMWLTLDPAAEELFFLQSIDEEIDFEEDTTMYNGNDFEVSLVGEGKIVEDDEETDGIAYKDFESGDGERIRIFEYETSGEIIALIGSAVGEDELHQD